MDIDTLSTQIPNQNFYWSNIVENEKYPYLDDSSLIKKLNIF